MGLRFYIVQFLVFLREVYRSRWLILQLTKNDFRNRFLGHYLGILWAFVQPTVTILIFYFVFQIGFKAGPVDNFPFVLWLMAGIIPWFFFSDCLSTATNSVLENSYLVKKVVFRISILPIVKMLSAMIIHLFFIAFLFIMFGLYGHSPRLIWLQLFYYSFCVMVLVLGLSWFTSSVVVFFRDLGQVIAVGIQFGFWLTPIFWSFKMIPVRWMWLFKLNPMYYIVDGYRETLINGHPFWQHYMLMTQFWLVTFAAFVCGALVFNRLRPHLADVI